MQNPSQPSPVQPLSAEHANNAPQQAQQQQTPQAPQPTLQAMRLRDEPPVITPAPARSSRKRKSPGSINDAAQPPPPPPPQPQPIQVIPGPPPHGMMHPLQGPMPPHYPYPAPDYTPGGLPPPNHPQPTPEVSAPAPQVAPTAGGRTLSQSKRAEQNRKAQRAFRERRDQHVKALESRSQLLDAALASADEANRRWEECRALVDQLRVENAALRAALSQAQAQLLAAGASIGGPGAAGMVTEEAKGDGGSESQGEGGAGEGVSLATLSAIHHSPSALPNRGQVPCGASFTIRDAVFFLMSISFGALGLMSFRHPVTGTLSIFSGNNDLSSLFCLIVFIIILLVLAYLTNPPESSFRAYLTEQSFRHHLSRLDDSTDDDFSLSKRTTLPISRSSSSALQSSSSLYFTNRASVSLRTPKHVLNSFGVFTLAAIIPLPRPEPPIDCDDSNIKDSWYIGAFGKWWRGGIMDPWSGAANVKDEEGYSSGVLSFNNLDMPHPTAHLSLNGYPGRGSSRGTPPRLRNRDRTLHKVPPSARSPTPPPLPKSICLPLHNPRIISPPEPATAPVSHPSATLPPSGSVVDTSSQVSLAAILSYDHHPRIQEIQRQIKISQTSVRELHTQLEDQQATAYQSHETLQKEVEACRSRKKQEDSSRSDLKFRTKSLEDAKRSAESAKREAEKRLKAAQRLQQTTVNRIEHLDQEITQMLTQMENDHSLVLQNQESIDILHHECADDLETTRQEIKTVEDIVTTLNQRARELEQHISRRKDVLQQTLDHRQQQRQRVASNQLKPSAPLIYDVHFSAMDMLDKLSPKNSSHESIKSVSHLTAPFVQGFEGSMPCTANSNGSPASPKVGAVSLPESARLDDAHSPSPVNSSFLASLNTSLDNERPVSLTPREVLRQSPQWDFAQPARSFSSDYTPVSIDADNARTMMRYGGWAPQDAPANYSISSNRLVEGVIPSKDFPTPGGKQYVRLPTSREKHSIGFNRDAKAFHHFNDLSDNSPTLGLGSHITSSLLRAFAPSAAEREHFRALGGSANASFERLPSLSDVSTVSPSSDGHAPSPDDPVGEMSSLPSWLRAFSLPNDGKSNFCPWDDDDTLEPPSTTNR
ncbi:hypothetical protein AX16_005210 [Volvariella volvacea WC 439]|nr:hypothetical protein AX16_005210 [Volvariella volvacea WC 439]